MNTVKIDNYTFDKVAKTVTFTDNFTVALENIISITDTTNNVQIFYSKLSSFGGTLVGQVLTLNYNTDSLRFLNTDDLLIEYTLDNYSSPIVSSEARDVTGNSSSITNYGNKGVVFIINVSAASGTTPELTVKLQVQDIVSGTWIDVPGAVTPTLTTAGSSLLTVYPGVTVSANVAISFPLPRTYRIAWTVDGTTPSFTFSVGAHYIK